MRFEGQFSDLFFRIWESGHERICGGYVEGVVLVGVVLYSDEVRPIVESLFPQRG